MKRTGHVMILASAGSGKTYALTNRFVRLLAEGAAPDRIVALTFTRKAAGEFFDEILRKLARGAAGAEAARVLAAEIKHPGLQPEDFLRMLRSVVDAMPRLSLGTLDQFFARIVRGFPLELGLAGDFTLLEEAAAAQERRRVMSRLFAAAGALDAAQRAFIEGFKRATFGTEEKQLGRWLDSYLRKHGEVFLAAPEAGIWGNPTRIWPQGNEWLDATTDRERAAATLRAALPWAQMSDGQRERFEVFLRALSTWRPGAPLGPMEYLVANVLDGWDGVRAGRAEITVDRKKLSLDPAASKAIADVIRAIVGAEVARRLEMTKGIFSVLQGYEAHYHELVRRAGRLTFADVQRLLLPEAGAPRLSSDAAAEGRLLVDWRLDARFDHWLLDEFQDTSFGQWSVLHNLIDEAVQDPEGRRSFFYVGDVKQSIFGWRAGDSRLFREIFDHYNRAEPGAIAEEHQTDSWRSGPAVIAMVNKVFADGGAIAANVPAEAAARWADEWLDHSSARPALGGRAELRHAEDEAGRFDETLRLIREIEPARRGLAAAVIVQTNDVANRLADHLRRHGGLAAVSESEQSVALDNPLTCALLALLRLAAHPGDSFAREHLAMTPLQAILRECGLADPDILTPRLLTDLQAEGFAATLDGWLRLIEPVLAPNDKFSRMRGRQLVEAAREFDEAGLREVAAFLDWVESFKVRDTDAPDVVRVLTVHKAKGLGFDVVILPDLESSIVPRRSDGLAVHRAGDRSVSWIVSPVEKVLGSRDEVLEAHFAGTEAEGAYEALCTFYVAMTRAKQAMYLITQPVKKGSRARTFPRVLEQSLGDAWESGDPDWYRQIERRSDTGSTLPPLSRLPAEVRRRAPRLPARRPSDAGGDAGKIALFATVGAGAAKFGTQVHELFETIEWWDASSQQSWEAARQAEGAAPSALAEVLSALRIPAVAAAFGAPHEPAQVWRERAFEIVLDGVWLSGVFDRVEIRRGPDGRAASARVVDFKTDRVRPGEDPAAAALDRHGHQLNQYRRVVAALTGLDPGQVECTLVLTSAGLVVPVPRG